MFSPVQSRTVDQTELTHSDKSALYRIRPPVTQKTHVEAEYHYTAIRPRHKLGRHVEQVADDAFLDPSLCAEQQRPPMRGLEK